MDAADSSKKWVAICQTVQCYRCKDNNISINKDIKKKIHPSQLRGFINNILGDITHFSPIFSLPIPLNSFEALQAVSGEKVPKPEEKSVKAVSSRLR